jgi:hypothetical protein
MGSEFYPILLRYDVPPGGLNKNAYDRLVCERISNGKRIKGVSIALASFSRTVG